MYKQVKGEQKAQSMIAKSERMDDQMHKLISLMLVLALSLCLVDAQAEETKDNFLVSDWKLVYSYGDTVIAEQTVFLYEDKTFEVMDENESKKGTWTFNGKTLELSAGDDTLPLMWDATEHRFSTEYNGLTVLLYMPIEPEGNGQAAEKPSEKRGVDLLGLITSMMSPKEDQPETKEPEKEEGPEPEADPSSWKTLADVLSLKTDSHESSWDEKSYTYIFNYAGTQWLVKAAFSKELNDAVSAVDFRAEDRDEQINAILGPCEIQKVIDLRTLALPQEELDQWIGKTGQDLLDAGWLYNGYYSDGNGIRICMVNGDFQYRVAFAEELVMPQVYGEQPENMPAAAISGIMFDGKSYNFDESNY